MSFFFFSSRRRHTRWPRDWSSDVCSSDLTHVNLASRLESAAEPDEILISHETWSLVKDAIMCRDKGEITVKGMTHPVKVYQVVDFRKDLGKNQSYFEDRAEGFIMYLDLEKVRNYEKGKVIRALETAAEKLRDKVIT